MSELILVPDLHVLAPDGRGGKPREPRPAEASQVAALHDAGIAALSTGDAVPLLERLAAAISAVTGAASSTAFDIDTESGQLCVIDRDLPPAVRKLCLRDGELARLAAAGLRLKERIFVDDVRAPSAHSSEGRRALLQANILAWQATPLLARSGAPLAVTFSFYAYPFRLSDRQQQAIDRLARQAADFIEHARVRRYLEAKCVREEAARVQADAANLRKDQFLATLSHEIRQPLAAALPAFELQRLGADEFSRRRASDVLGHQLAHIGRLVEDLNDVWHISRGTLELHPQQLDLRCVVEQAIDISRPSLDARRHELVADLGLEPAWTSVDGTRMKQVFANLLRNAGWYTPPGGRIRVTVRTEDSDVVCRVTDNGAGIASDALTRVFELFERGAVTGQPTGSGIGLAVVRQIVALHHGSVVARSDGHGRGSEFIVRLPAACIEPLAS